MREELVGQARIRRHGERIGNDTAAVRVDLKGLRLRDVKTGVQSILHVSGVFLGIGHDPNAKAFHGQIDLDSEGYIRTENNVFTTHKGVVVPGVYACGDVQDRRYRQAITAAGTGCMAALEAEKFLEEHGH